jgi:hypothetical protein
MSILEDLSEGKREIEAYEALHPEKKAEKDVIDSIRNWTDLRPAVRKFAIAMEERLKANDYKGGWDNCSAQYLMNGLLEELAELSAAILEGDFSGINEEAVDVANYAMMLADIHRAL